MRWGLRPPEVEQYLQILASLSEVVAPLSGSPIVLRDMDDDPIVYTAVAGGADVLCTLDAHFYEDAVQSFCAQKGVKIMDDVELLRLIRNQEKRG